MIGNSESEVNEIWNIVRYRDGELVKGKDIHVRFESALKSDIASGKMLKDDNSIDHICRRKAGTA